MDEFKTDEDQLRRLAIERINKRSDFKAHLLAYVLVNTMLVAIWAMTSASYFWPIWVIGGWGIGVAFNAWDVYRRPFPTEGQIRREIDHLREPHA